MILLVWVSNASQGAGTLWNLRKVGSSDHRPRKDFHPVGAVFAGRGGTALCFPVLRLPSCPTECGGRPCAGLLQSRAEKYHGFGNFSPQIEKINGESPFFPKQQHHLPNKNILLLYGVLREGRGSTGGQIFQAAKHLEPPNTVCLFCARHCWGLPERHLCQLSTSQKGADHWRLSPDKWLHPAEGSDKDFSAAQWLPHGQRRVWATSQRTITNQGVSGMLGSHQRLCLWLFMHFYDIRKSVNIDSCM